MFSTSSRIRTAIPFYQGRRPSHSQPVRRGLTLVEMLISMAVTLVMMAAVVNLFANIGSGVRTRRASMELGGQLRMARARLFKDLAGATSAVRPKLPSDDHDDGYLEIIEGQWSEKSPSALVTAAVINNPNGILEGLDSQSSIIPRDNNGQLIQWNDANGNGVFDSGETYFGGRSGLGDYDDILALTVRSESEPFVGRLPVWNATATRWDVTTIESQLAEVIWYAVENPADSSFGEPGMRTIYRRVLLIAPWVSDLPSYPGTSPPAKNIAADQVYCQLCDVSFHREGDVRVANTLSDLTKRENRFGHQLNGPTTFPHPLDTTAIRIVATDANYPTDWTVFPVLHPFGLPFEWDPSDPDFENPTVPPVVDRRGEDVVLNDVLAFDLRVYDAGAPLYSEPTTNTITEPSDAGWVTGGAAQGYGAFVDLGWLPTYSWTGNEPAPRFQTQHQAGWHSAVPGNRQGYPCLYDTWPYHYEDDGIDQDNGMPTTPPATWRNVVDQGTDGLDSDNFNGVDDVAERETSPPYDTPLRGVQVKLRVYDRDSRQIREATVTRNFVPQ